MTQSKLLALCCIGTGILIWLWLKEPAPGVGFITFGTAWLIHDLYHDHQERTQRERNREIRRELHEEQERRAA